MSFNNPIRQLLPELINLNDFVLIILAFSLMVNLSHALLQTHGSESTLPFILYQKPLIFLFMGIFILCTMLKNMKKDNTILLFINYLFYLCLIF